MKFTAVKRSRPVLLSKRSYQRVCDALARKVRPFDQLFSEIHGILVGALPLKSFTAVNFVSCGVHLVVSLRLVYPSVSEDRRSLAEKNGHRLESSITTKDRFEGRRCPLWTLYYATTPK